MVDRKVQLIGWRSNPDTGAEDPWVEVAILFEQEELESGVEIRVEGLTPIMINPNDLRWALKALALA